MRRCWPSLLLLILASAPVAAEPAGKFPPDSLVNLKVFPKDTPVQQVVSTMRGITGALGVRCQYCHVGEEGKPLDSYDFSSDEKRPKAVARQMMRMVMDINARLAEIPQRPTPPVEVKCGTCHRGVARPMPLNEILSQTLTTAGVDSAMSEYRHLRERYFGRAAYDFGEETIPATIMPLVQEHRFEDALSMLRLNEEFFPGSSGTQAMVGEVYLAKGDTATAVTAFQEALKRNPEQRQAKRRLQELGK